MVKGEMVKGYKKGMSDNTQNIPPSVVTYLKRIGQTPLLKPEEEKAFFEELR